jgi:hypothetical protein
MKAIRFISLWLLIGGSAAGVARGAPFRTDINPAMAYYQAFVVDSGLSEADRSYLLTQEWRGQKLPERFGELVARYDNQFRLVCQAAQATVACDWGVDMSAGPYTLLGHLSRCRAIAQVARVRAMWDLQQGRPTDARGDLLAAFALGRNAAQDGTMISALVQIAVEGIVCATMAENLYRFSPETLKQMADGFAAAPPRLTMAASLPSEKALFPDWFAGRILELQKAHPGDDAKVMAYWRIVRREA